MDNAEQQLADKLKAANNVLVTVSRNPSVDQLSALLGLTLILNKQGKHAAAVYSGNTPSTIEFLEPEETIEKNTDSLRDFIIALDKNKADKLRYKVEDDVVRIFITPYRTSISQDDFEFSEGDFNVDIVIALGVNQQEDLDEAITAHGRILHDATVASVGVSSEGSLGSINWNKPEASSLSQMITELSQELGPNLLDEQIATALLTGIVSETERFSNDKTSSGAMSASATLMGAGANQQLVASKLEEPLVDNPSINDSPSNDLDSSDSDGATDDGTIQIDHTADAEESDDQQNQNEPLPEPVMPSEGDANSQPLPEPSDGMNASAPTEQGTSPTETSSELSPGSKMITTPPTMGGKLTANSESTEGDGMNQSYGMPNSEEPQLLQHQINTLPVLPEPAVPPNAAEPIPPNLPLPAPEPVVGTGEPGSQPMPLPEPISMPAPNPINAPEQPTMPTFAPASPEPPTPLVPPAPPTPPIPPTPPPAEPEPPMAMPSLTTTGPPPQPAPAKPAHKKPEVLPDIVISPDKPIVDEADEQPPAGPSKNDDNEPKTTLEDLEKSVNSPHLQHVESARDEVDKALNDLSAPDGPEPTPDKNLGSKPLGEDLHPAQPQPQPTMITSSEPAPQPTMITPEEGSKPEDSNSPPPVPPPIPFRFGGQ